MMQERALRLLPAEANSDGEFKIAARLWDGDVVLVSGADAVRLVVKGGQLVASTAANADDEVQIRIVGPPEGWEKMLQSAPPPFYHDLYGAQVHHGFTIHGAIEDVGPYYPALRRLIELLRSD